MKTFIKLITLTLITLYFKPQTAIAQCHIDDWTALKALYDSTKGDFWTNRTGWGTILGDSPPFNCNLGNLYGIELNENGRVEQVNLGNNQLNGKIPSQLEDLFFLRILSLHSNNLIENIPITFGNFNNLEELILSLNNLSGTIPSELGNLIELEDLRLGSNFFSGNIPSSIGNLVNLKWLELSDNELSGTIPIEIGLLSELQNLFLYGNKLTGNIPTELGNLVRLEVLWLSGNLLEGSIPIELSNLINLKYLYLGLNQLSGQIPSELGNLNQLLVLSLHENLFNNNIPSELGNLSSLINLNLFSNLFTGHIPLELGNLSNLINLNLAHNQLNGSIPTEFENLTNLEVLLLSYNLLTGSLPSELSFLANLILLDISNNQLSGCYNNNLGILCNQLTSDFFNGNLDISYGNNFDASWENFCETESGVCEDADPISSTNVWPGDVNYDGKVNNADRSIQYLFFNESGTPRNQQGIDWQAYPAIDWGIPQANGNDIKHFDCDGNGFINFNDNNAIIDNWGETHNEGFNNSDVPNSIGFGLFGTDYQIYLRPTNQVNTNPLIMDVVLESKDGNDLNLFGGYFTIDYHNVNAHITDADIVFYNSWLGIPNNNLMWDYRNFPNSKKIEIAFSKTNGVASLGSGVIGQVAFQIDHSTFNLNPTNPLIVNFAVNQIGAHDTEGNLLPIEDQQYAVNIGNNTCTNNLTVDENSPFQNLYKSGNSITTDSLVIIGQNQQVEYRANRITLTEGFSARAGAHFKVRYGGCN